MPSRGSIRSRQPGSKQSHQLRAALASRCCQHPSMPAWLFVRLAARTKAINEVRPAGMEGQNVGEETDPPLVLLTPLLVVVSRHQIGWPWLWTLKPECFFCFYVNVSLCCKGVGWRREMETLRSGPREAFSCVIRWPGGDTGSASKYCS